MSTQYGTGAMPDGSPPGWDGGEGMQFRGQNGWKFDKKIFMWKQFFGEFLDFLSQNLHFGKVLEENFTNFSDFEEGLKGIR